MSENEDAAPLAKGTASATRNSRHEVTTASVIQVGDGYRWWGHRCPILVAADLHRGDPKQVRAMVWLHGAWLRHAPKCKALER